jgi:acyl-CoA reductase-like NAD-dependent aldehyde dehydrogenase
MMNWQQRAAEVRWNIRPFIDGRYQESASKDTFENIDPATERSLCRIQTGSAEDVDVAVGIARKRFEDGCWSNLPAVRRAEVLCKFADLIVRHSEELALLDSLEMGKPISESLRDVEIVGPWMMRSWAGFADKLVGASAPLYPTAMMVNSYAPRGVIGAITPWNFPMSNAVVKIAPALAAGNTLVLKPSELASSSALKLAELALEAGIPEGVLNIVPGLGTTVGAALAFHPDVDMLSFTGSTATGRRIMELAARSNGKPVLLECGGKSPHVVFADVKPQLDRVADAVARGILFNQGQVCSAHTRLVVDARLKEALLDKVVSRLATCKPGQPLDPKTTFGPLASPVQRDRVKAYIEQGLNGGARAVLKGTVQERGGCYVTPTVFDQVSTSMAIVREEIFGPVLCVQTFTSDDEAIHLANEADYGLVATVWTRDLGRSKRMAHAIRAGVLYMRTGDEEGADSGCMLSHEPRKASGFGAELGLGGLQSYSVLKMIHWTGA